MFTIDQTERFKYFQKIYVSQGLTAINVTAFQDIIYAYYRTDGRDFPWRRTREPYHIFVSEMMLQQTQTDRVRSKYVQFVHQFPDFAALADSPLDRVLAAWQGLGYNRRAIALHEIASTVMNDYDGILPNNPDQLVTLPGIGKATASSIVAFAFDKPVVFVETNIRALYIFFYFPDALKVSDKEIKPLVERTLDRSQPGRWYSALLDFGVNLKKTFPELNKKSAHYMKQAPFQGSNRQIRGQILRLLLNQGALSPASIIDKLNKDPKRVTKILQQLQTEGFLFYAGDRFSIAPAKG